MTKKTLRIDSPPADKLAALKAAAKKFNSHCSQIICGLIRWLDRE